MREMGRGIEQQEGRSSAGFLRLRWVRHLVLLAVLAPRGRLASSRGLGNWSLERRCFVLVTPAGKSARAGTSLRCLDGGWLLRSSRNRAVTRQSDSPGLQAGPPGPKNIVLIAALSIVTFAVHGRGCALKMGWLGRFWRPSRALAMRSETAVPAPLGRGQIR